MGYCSKCGQELGEVNFCGKCGNARRPPMQPSMNTDINSNGREMNKWIALALCFFLGVLGAHKFYEGKTGQGILYLFTGGLLGIGVLIDFISLLLKPNPYYV